MILACFLPGAFLDQARALGIDARLYAQRSRFDLSVVKGLAHLCTEEGVSLIHSHGARANFVTALLRRRLAVPAITTVHSDYLLDFVGNPYKRLVFTMLNSWALRRFDRYLAVTGQFKEMLAGRGFPGPRIDVVYNGLDFGRPVQVEPREEFLARHNVPASEHDVIVGCLGRLHPVKGQDVLLAAVARLLGSEPLRGRLRLLLAGEDQVGGVWADRARRLEVGDRVHFLGHLGDGLSFLNALDVHVLPSRSESLPYALLEAAQVRTACVATAVGGIPEIILDGVTGLLVPPEDAGALAAAILRLAADPDLRRRMGQELHSHAAARFSIDGMVETHLQVYRELLASRSGGQ